MKQTQADRKAIVLSHEEFAELLVLCIAVEEGTRILFTDIIGSPLFC